MECPKCGATDLEAGATICSYCGSVVAVARPVAPAQVAPAVAASAPAMSQADVSGLKPYYQEVFREIDQNGGKMFWPAGCTTKGAMFKIGSDPAPGEPVLVCEGFATGAAIQALLALRPRTALRLDAAGAEEEVPAAFERANYLRVLRSWNPPNELTTRPQLP